MDLKKVFLLLMVLSLFCVGCNKESILKSIKQDNVQEDIGTKTENENRIKITDVGFFTGQESPSQKSTTFTKNSTVWMAYDIEKISYLSDSEAIAMRQDLVILNPNKEVILAIPSITTFKDTITEKPNLFTNKITLDADTTDGVYTVIINVVDLYTLYSDRVVTEFAVVN